MARQSVLNRSKMRKKNASTIIAYL